MFFSKDIDSKLESWVNKGLLGKVIKTATTDDNEINRAKAYAAMGKLRDKASVEAILECFKLDETDMVRLSAAKALGMIATRKEFDTIQHVIDVEENEEIKEALKASLLEAKERSPRW